MVDHIMTITLKQMDGKSMKNIIFPFDTTVFARNDLFFVV